MRVPSSFQALLVSFSFTQNISFDFPSSGSPKTADCQYFLFLSLFWSGGNTGGPCPSQDAWLFDSNKKTWEEQEVCASPRIYSSMAMLPTAPNGGKNISVAVLFGGTEKNSEVLQVNLLYLLEKLCGKCNSDSKRFTNEFSSRWRVYKGIYPRVKLLFSPEFMGYSAVKWCFEAAIPRKFN